MRARCAIRCSRRRRTRPDRPKAKKAELYIHAPRGRRARHIDDATETFVDETRMGATP